MDRPALDASRRVTVRQAVIVLLLGVAVLGAVGIAPPARTVAGPPTQREQLRFMWAMSVQESGGDYYARNTSSGAFGKYQIMPFNWPVWAAEYLGDARADQTPYNQEKVAYGKLRDLYRWLGSWKRVAYWWLTGSSDANEKRWSSYAKGYVVNIMRLRKRAPAAGVSMPARTSSRSARGDWRRSGGTQKLRVAVGGKPWPERGTVRAGQTLRVMKVARGRTGERWIRVVSADGRLGWLRQAKTVPARRPSAAHRWRDVKTTATRSARTDRSLVRPRPR